MSEQSQGIKCELCGSNETYVYTKGEEAGRVHWNHIEKDGKTLTVCNRCGSRFRYDDLKSRKERERERARKFKEEKLAAQRARGIERRKAVEDRAQKRIESLVKREVWIKARQQTLQGSRSLT